MRTSLLVLAVAVLLVGTVSAQYHDSKYLFGAYGNTSSLYSQGPWMADAGNQTFTELAPTGRNWYYGYGMTMDVDNKKVINLPRGSTSASYHFKSGVFRTDPATKTVTTVFADQNMIYSNVGPIHVNQDGDYVFMAYTRVTVSSANTYHYRLYKVPSLGGSISTLLSTTQLGWTGTTTIYQGGQADINTGEYVVQLYNSSANVRYGLFNLSLDGSTLTTWSTGGGYGLYTYYYDGLLQDWDTGNWLSAYSGYLYELKPGTTSRTTLWNLGYPGGLSLYGNAKFDNRSAPKKRAMFGAYMLQNLPTLYYAPVVCAIDLSGPPYTVTAINCDPQQKTARTRNYPYAFNFYRGRHIQTLLGSPGKWQLLLSFPNYPGKSYVAAISISGYKPPIKLGDGRKIYLRPDSLTQPSMNGWLAPIFNPGPGKLDANGEAMGSLDFTKVPLTGIPLWIAVAVLDPKAPGGVAYLPDTYVFRTP